MDQGWAQMNDEQALADEQTEKFVNEPVQRRWWLLRRAMEMTSLENALQLAAQAEAFLVGDIGSIPAGTREFLSPSTATPVEHAARNPISGQIRAEPAHRPELLLEPDRKAELQARLAAGVPNADVAAEFGLTPRQVQGFRMQIARKAASREKRMAEAADPICYSNGIPTATRSPLVEEVIRYLRQQGDVVVGSPQSSFTVNNRFQLDFEQLVNRANKMRARQGKPEFGETSRYKEDGN